MKRSLPGIALIAILGCAETEIPPIELGGGSGARLMNGKGENVYDAYNIHYSNLSKQHYNVRRNLEQRGRNTYGARIAMGKIASHLERMRSVVTPEFRDAMTPYIADYRKWEDALRSGRWGGSYRSDFDRSEREIKSKFNPGRVQFATAEAAPADPVAADPGPAPASAPAPAKPVSPNVPSDRAEVPATPPPPPAAAPSPAPASPPNAKPAISFRLAYRAWSSAHDTLVKTYQAKKECGENYTEVVEALGLMKTAAPAGRVAKLQIYRDYYRQIHQKTKGFTTLPDKTTRQEIVDELDVAARVIRGEFNPDK